MKRILIADEDSATRILLRGFVRAAVPAAWIETVEDGVEAFEKLVACYFELAVIDNRIPRMSGTGILRAIRRKGIETDIVLLSAWATAEEANAAARAGAWDFLEKPVELHRLLYLVQNLFQASRRKVSLWRERSAEKGVRS